MATNIESKIKAGEYVSLQSARSAIARAKGLHKGTRKRLEEMAVEWFAPKTRTVGEGILTIEQPRDEFTEKAPVFDVRMSAAAEAYAACANTADKFNVDIKTLMLDMMRIHTAFREAQNNPNIGIDGKKGV